MAQKVRYGMVIDLRRCIGCQACAVSCKAENDVPLGVFRNWVDTMEVGGYPNTKRYFLPVLCNHCEEPVCAQACPVAAIYKRDDGLVLVDHEKCENVRACIEECPYARIFTNPVRVTAGKCTFCEHRVDKGIEPACVTTCQGRARIFGDLNDPSSEAAQLLAKHKPIQLLPEEGTGPRI